MFSVSVNKEINSVLLQDEIRAVDGSINHVQVVQQGLNNYTLNVFADEGFKTACEAVVAAHDHTLFTPDQQAAQDLATARQTLEAEHTVIWSGLKTIAKDSGVDVAGYVAFARACAYENNESQATIDAILDAATAQTYVQGTEQWRRLDPAEVDFSPIPFAKLQTKAMLRMYGRLAMEFFT